MKIGAENVRRAARAALIAADVQAVQGDRVPRHGHRSRRRRRSTRRPAPSSRRSAPTSGPCPETIYLVDTRRAWSTRSKKRCATRSRTSDCGTSSAARAAIDAALSSRRARRSAALTGHRRAALYSARFAAPGLSASRAGDPLRPAVLRPVHRRSRSWSARSVNAARSSSRSSAAPSRSARRAAATR